MSAKGELLELYRRMQLIRRLEEEAARAYVQGKIGGFLHLYIGQEAIAVGTEAAIRKTDFVVTTYRDYGFAIVRGTPAKGTYAPDLTHLMARDTLASGMAPNDPANLDQWVRDPQTIKPDCLMPAFGLSDAQRDQVVRYLRSLK